MSHCGESVNWNFFWSLSKPHIFLSVVNISDHARPKTESPSWTETPMRKTSASEPIYVCRWGNEVHLISEKPARIGMSVLNSERVKSYQRVEWEPNSVVNFHRPPDCGDSFCSTPPRPLSDRDNERDAKVLSASGTWTWTLRGTNPEIHVLRLHSLVDNPERPSGNVYLSRVMLWRQCSSAPNRTRPDPVPLIPSVAFQNPSTWIASRARLKRLVEKCRLPEGQIGVLHSDQVCGWI